LKRKINKLFDKVLNKKFLIYSIFGSITTPIILQICTIKYDFIIDINNSNLFLSSKLKLFNHIIGAFMKKLKLNIENLKVDSFDFALSDAKAKGTVQGNLPTFPEGGEYTCDLSCPVDPTCISTCFRLMCPTSLCPPLP
jgi:hypothetical protein